jgi:hypothetical protein
MCSFPFVAQKKKSTERSIYKIRLATSMQEWEHHTPLTLFLLCRCRRDHGHESLSCCSQLCTWLCVWLLDVWIMKRPKGETL